MAARQWLRWVLVGRKTGLRSKVRRALGLFTWLDRDATSSTASQPPQEQAPPTPRPAPAPPSSEESLDGWVRVLGVEEVPAGSVVEVLVGERPVAVANVDGTFLAVDGTCPHAGGPLGDGVLDGAVLTCPWHGWGWDLRTGRSTVDEDQVVETVPLKVSGGGLWIAAP